MSINCDQLFQKCYHNQWVTQEERATFLKNCNARQRRSPGIQPPPPSASFSMSAGDDDVTYSQCREHVGGVVHRQALPLRSFWTTTPFQIMGAAQQLGRDLDAAAKSPIVAPLIGAAAFLGLAAGAISQLRFGNIAPLQRLVETL